MQRRLTAATGFLIFVFIAFLAGRQGFFLESCLSLSLLLALCFSALPVTELIFADKILARAFVLPVGYVLHSLLLSLCGSLFGVHRLTLLIYLTATLALYLWLRSRAPAKKNEITQTAHWQKADTVLLFVWLLLTLGIVALPFLKVGAESPSGLAYRRFFNADFFRNMAVTASLSTTGIPPENPYFSDVVLSYHWFFLVIPAYWKSLFSSFRTDLMLVQFSLFAIMMFVISLFVVFRKLTTSRKSLALLFPLFAFGGSFEGIYLLYLLKPHQSPWHAFKSLNVDGFLRGVSGTPQVDTLYRALLYAPQHLIVLCIFLMFLVGFRFQHSRTTRCLFYVLLFTGLGFSSFIAGLLIAGMGCVIVAHTLRDIRRNWFDLATFSFIGLLSLGLYLLELQIFHLEHAPLHFGPDMAIGQNPLRYFLGEWGAILILGIAGAFWASPKMPRRILAPLLLASMFLIFFTRVETTDRSVFSIKFGYLSNLILLLLAAGFIDWLLLRWQDRALRLLLPLFILILPASLTWVMDAYNTQDIRNTRFTTYLSPHQAEVLDWVRETVPPSAVIQDYWMEDRGYGRFVTEIPPFAERPVFLSDPILSRLFQVPHEQARHRLEEVCQLFHATTPEEAHAVARRNRIEYLLFDNDKNLPAYSQMLQPYFSRIRHQGDVLLVRVNAVPSQARTFANSFSSGKLNPEGMNIDVSWRMVKNFYPPEINAGCRIAHWMSNDGQVLIRSKNESEVRVIFLAFPLGRERKMKLYLDEVEIGENVIKKSGTLISFPTRLTPGDHVLRIHSVDGAEDAFLYDKNSDSRLESFRIVEFRIRPHQTQEEEEAS